MSINYLSSIDDKKIVLTNFLRRKMSSTKYIPISLSQKRFWNLDQIIKGNPVCNLVNAYHIAGYLNLEALEECFHEIIKRHETLRTTFDVIEENLMQIIFEDYDFKLLVTDLENLTSEEKNIEVMRIIEKESSFCFNLIYGPLFRVNVIKLSQEEYVLLTNVHHISSDGWSISVLRKELSVLYKNFILRTLEALPSLKTSYTEYSLWQNKLMNSAKGKAELSFWTKRLKNIVPLTDHFVDMPRNKETKHIGKRLHLQLSDELYSTLKLFSIDKNCTLFLTMLSILKVLLYLESNTTDIIIGIPIYNRSYVEAENLIGCFSDFLLIRTIFDENITFLDLLNIVRNEYLQSVSNADLPIEYLANKLQFKSDHRHISMFQVDFNMLNFDTIELELHNLSVSRIEFDRHTIIFDLIFYALETGNNLNITLNYNIDLFKAETIKKILYGYEILAKKIMASPSLKLVELSI